MILDSTPVLICITTLLLLQSNACLHQLSLYALLQVALNNKALIGMIDNLTHIFLGCYFWLYLSVETIVGFPKAPFLVKEVQYSEVLDSTVRTSLGIYLAVLTYIQSGPEIWAYIAQIMCKCCRICQ